MKKHLLVALAATLACAAAQAHGPSVFSAVLLGSNEVGLFDADGAGTASATIDPHTGQLDWSITFSNLSNVLAAHIHAGAAGVNGPAIIDFVVPPGTSGSGTFAGSLIDSDAFSIHNLNAASFYFNVHTDEFPGGAIRGQLAPVPEAASYALMLGGIAALGGLARRRSKLNQA